MTNREYILLAMRTETTRKPLSHIDTTELSYSRVLHSALGCADEAGEIVKATKDWLFYGKKLDTTNLEEEYGDLLWFIALGLDAIGSSFEKVMEMNIRKLRVRYPDKFTEEAATERDLEAEHAKLKASKKRIWQGKPPIECEFCHTPITTQFVDGRVKHGPWGVMCTECHRTRGRGLGLGVGQRYEKQGDVFVAIEGSWRGY